MLSSVLSYAQPASLWVPGRHVDAALGATGGVMTHSDALKSAISTAVLSSYNTSVEIRQGRSYLAHERPGKNPKYFKLYFLC